MLNFNNEQRYSNIIGRRVRSFYDNGSLDGVIVGIEQHQQRQQQQQANRTPNLEENELIVAVRFDADPNNIVSEVYDELQLLDQQDEQQLLFSTTTTTQDEQNYVQFQQPSLQQGFQLAKRSAEIFFQLLTVFNIRNRHEIDSKNICLLSLSIQYRFRSICKD